MSNQFGKTPLPAGGGKEAIGRYTTEFLDMVVKLSKTPTLRDILASIRTWLLLASYVMFPSKFTSFRNLHIPREAGRTETTILKALRSIPFLWLAAFYCLLGAILLPWLWWACNKIFM